MDTGSKETVQVLTVLYYLTEYWSEVLEYILGSSQTPAGITLGDIIPTSGLCGHPKPCPRIITLIYIQE